MKSSHQSTSCLTVSRNIWAWLSLELCCSSLRTSARAPGPRLLPPAPFLLHPTHPPASLTYPHVPGSKAVAASHKHISSLPAASSSTATLQQQMKITFSFNACPCRREKPQLVWFFPNIHDYPVPHNTYSRFNCNSRRISIKHRCSTTPSFSLLGNKNMFCCSVFLAPHSIIYHMETFG